MSNKHWLIEAFKAGKLDKLVDKANRDYEEGRALDSLEPSPEPKEDQSQCLLAPSHGSANAFQYNPAHPIGTCVNCGDEMVYNVPRMGPAGGFVHKATGRSECNSPNVLMSRRESND